MQLINKNWTNEDGTYDGGQSSSEWFTIVWQRGPVGFPVDPELRNGAFLIEVLTAAVEAIDIKTKAVVGPTSSCGIGFTIVWGESLEEFMGVTRELLNSCILQVLYYQSQPRFACDENALAIGYLTDAREPWQGVQTRKQSIVLAIAALESRKSRRISAGAQGTTEGDADA